MSMFICLSERQELDRRKDAQRRLVYDTKGRLVDAVTRKPCWGHAKHPKPMSLADYRALKAKLNRPL
jgi:hypothetical protein